jgi:hypothetical protein
MEAQIDETRASFEGDFNELRAEVEQRIGGHSNPVQSGVDSQVVQ